MPVRSRVLVVDDYADAREMYSEYLQLSGFDVIEAANGVDAVRRAVEDHPDIILMDLSLPGMDGWEATQRLKADRRTGDDSRGDDHRSHADTRIRRCHQGGLRSLRDQAVPSRGSRQGDPAAARALQPPAAQARPRQLPRTLN